MSEPRDFPHAAREVLQDAQMRRNVAHATDVIRKKRDLVVAEHPAWQNLRDAGSAIRRHSLRHLDRYLLQFEAACTEAGGQVHWAADADSANRIVLDLLARHSARCCLVGLSYRRCSKASTGADSPDSIGLRPISVYQPKYSRCMWSISGSVRSFCMRWVRATEIVRRRV